MEAGGISMAALSAPIGGPSAIQLSMQRGQAERGGHGAVHGVEPLPTAKPAGGGAGRRDVQRGRADLVRAVAWRGVARARPATCGSGRCLAAGGMATFRRH